MQVVTMRDVGMVSGLFMTTASVVREKPPASGQGSALQRPMLPYDSSIPSPERLAYGSHAIL